LSVPLAVDWSGDPGVDPKSQPLCIMSVVAYEEDVLGSALARLREAKSLGQHYEFHYKDINDRSVKDNFMAAVTDIFIGAIVIFDKDAMETRDAWGRDTNLLVQLIIQCILLLPPGTIKGVPMTIDGKREVKVLERALRPALSKKLLEEEITDRLSKIGHAKSKDHNGIQLADMTAGAVREAISNRKKELFFLRTAHTGVRILQPKPPMERPYRTKYK